MNLLRSYLFVSITSNERPSARVVCDAWYAFRRIVILGCDPKTWVWFLLATDVYSNVLTASRTFIVK